MELNNIFNLEKAFGISTNISLNSFMKGGSTRTIDIKKIIVIKVQTIVRDNGLDILSTALTLLQRLHIIFAITREQIISNKKSLKLQNIKKQIPNIESFDNILLLNFKSIYLFSEYPNPFDLA